MSTSKPGVSAIGVIFQKNSYIIGENGVCLALDRAAHYFYKSGTLFLTGVLAVGPALGLINGAILGR
jgi:hypothetical protein